METTEEANMPMFLQDALKETIEEYGLDLEVAYEILNIVRTAPASEREDLIAGVLQEVAARED